MNDFLSGAIMVGAAAIGLFFARSYRRNQDRLFFLFALAFWLFALERWALVLIPNAHEVRPFVYLIRLAGFALIVLAIIDKNRSS